MNHILFTFIKRKSDNFGYPKEIFLVFIPERYELCDHLGKI